MRVLVVATIYSHHQRKSSYSLYHRQPSLDSSIRVQNLQACKSRHLFSCHHRNEHKFAGQDSAIVRLGRSISPEKGKAARHQYHTWKHTSSCFPPRKNKSPYLNRTTVPDYRSSKTFMSTGSRSLSSPQMPKYVKTDKICLRFYGYFQESVDASPDEVSRIRPVTIYYFVIDDTIKMVEPKSNNSGMPQGHL